MDPYPEGSPQWSAAAYVTTIAFIFFVGYVCLSISCCFCWKVGLTQKIWSLIKQLLKMLIICLILGVIGLFGYWLLLHSVKLTFKLTGYSNELCSCDGSATISFYTIWTCIYLLNRTNHWFYNVVVIPARESIKETAVEEELLLLRRSHRHTK